MSRFVRPDTTVLHISNGDTLIVKRRLNAGEQRDYYVRIADVGDDGKVRVNRLQAGPALILAYLVDWSLMDDDGRKVEIKGLSPQALEEILNALDPDSFAEIRGTIEGHERTQTQAREDEKKSRDGWRDDGMTSRSRSAPAGALIGSVS